MFILLEFVCPTRAHRKTVSHDQCFRYSIHIASDLPLGFHCVSKSKEHVAKHFSQWLIVACNYSYVSLQNKSASGFELKTKL